MFLFLPIRTDSPVRRYPYVNQLLIGFNIVIFGMTDLFANVYRQGWGDQIKQQLMIFPRDLHVYQFLTYQFLHGDFWHLFGNMLFLWTFGNSVNAKMGNLTYLLFYLAGGVFAGVGFAVESDNPCLGASGSVAAVTTAFLVLFPRSEVTTFYWIWFYIGTWHIQAMLLIVAKIIVWDNVLSPYLSKGDGPVQVAYSAHLAGYFFGFTLGVLMLLLRALPRDQYDILALWKRYYQRKSMQIELADPNARVRATYGRVARPVSSTTGELLPEQPAPPPDAVTRLRGEIASLLSDGDYAAAADRWLELLAQDAEACLPRRQLLDVANQLMTGKRYEDAATAYERYLKHYPNAPDAEQIKLVLGIVYARYLERYEPAQRYLRDCARRLTNPQLAEQARQWLEVATSALGRPPSTA